MMADNRYIKIREHYDKIRPQIFEAASKDVSRWTSPYSKLIDWPALLTHIEDQTWQVIRGYGKIPLYPQYPVGGVFVDFGNPVLKIAVECDGKDYHKDKEKDFQRDKNLFLQGWKVYRISGSDCNRQVPVEYSEISYLEDCDKHDAIKKYYLETIEGLIQALAVVYCDERIYYESESEMDLVNRCLDERGFKNVAPKKSSEPGKPDEDPF